MKYRLNKHVPMQPFVIESQYKRGREWAPCARVDSYDLALKVMLVLKSGLSVNQLESKLT